MILTHPLPVPIEITSAGVVIPSYSEGGQDLRHSLRVVADHGVESLVWCIIVIAIIVFITSSYDEGVVHLHSTCSTAVLSYSLDNN